ncbi:MAG: hypothetical protein K9K67_00625 [Bacteriovoracaceae bacterium]|nr:hypothetical protein [Bacteriovoracaceae bacterium]
MNILTTSIATQIDDLEVLLTNRLNYFRPQGLEFDFIYQSKIKNLQELAIEKQALNRIIYGLFSFFLNSDQHLKIEVNNCDRFLNLSISSKNRSFLSLKNGFSLPSPLSPHWNSVYTQVRESGGKLTFSKWACAGPKVSLQIPLYLLSDNLGPQMRAFFVP